MTVEGDGERPARDAPGRSKIRAVGAVAGVAKGAARVTVSSGVSFTTGTFCVLRGLKRMVHTPWLWPYAAAPVVVALLSFVGVIYWLVNWLAPAMQEVVASRLPDWLASAAWFFTAAGLIGAGLIAMYFAFPAIVRVFAAPFLALLADKTYESVSGHPAPAPPGSKFVRWVVRPIYEAVVLLGIRIVVTVVALPLLCVPVVGTIAFFMIMLPLEGMDLLDLAQSARALPFGERLRFVRRNWIATSGLGLGAAGVLLIPFVNVFLLPSLVVGAVLLDQRMSPDFAGPPEAPEPAELPEPPDLPGPDVPAAETP